MEKRVNYIRHLTGIIGSRKSYVSVCRSGITPVQEVLAHHGERVGIIARQWSFRSSDWRTRYF
jgi:hypothetical protein